MRCSKCGYEESKVIDSRSLDDGKAIRRRRECLKCGFRFTTYEKTEIHPLVVIKKNQIRQIFDRDKIINGLINACEKRAVSRQSIEKIADDIELELSNKLKSEVTSYEIGEMVMERLKDLDQVAYVRFASVYKEFKDIEEFRKELKKFLGDF